MRQARPTAEILPELVAVIITNHTTEPPLEFSQNVQGCGVTIVMASTQIGLNMESARLVRKNIEICHGIAFNCIEQPRIGLVWHQIGQLAANLSNIANPVKKIALQLPFSQYRSAARSPLPRL